jgi:large subunit ribosomal protein L23
MTDFTQIVRRPLITEKGVDAAQRLNSYQFEVALNATKAQIKEAIQQVFNVRVQGVRTLVGQTKPRRRRGQRGRVHAFKKAIVRLVPGDTIEFI